MTVGKSLDAVTSLSLMGLSYKDFLSISSLNCKGKVEIIPSAKSVVVSSLMHSGYSLLSILWEVLLKTISSALVDKAINITNLTSLQSTT